MFQHLYRDNYFNGIETTSAEILSSLTNE